VLSLPSCIKSALVTEVSRVARQLDKWIEAHPNLLHVLSRTCGVTVLNQKIEKLKNLNQNVDIYYNTYAAHYYSSDNLVLLMGTVKDYLAFMERMKWVDSLDAFGLQQLWDTFG